MFSHLKECRVREKVEIVNNFLKDPLSYEINEDSIRGGALAQGEGVLNTCMALSLACWAIEMRALNLWYSK